MASLIEHFESHLGPITCGWSKSPDGDAMGFQVVKFDLRGLQWAAYSTLGLSKFVLHSGTSGKEIRQELIVLAPEGFGDQNIPAVMQSIATEALGSKHAYLHGDVIGPRGNLFDGFPFTAFYVTVPVYLPASLQSFKDDNKPSVVFAWLVPITNSEARFVATEGWRKFESLLQQGDPDLVDFTRRAVA